jgi:octaprenyl-diphosphate synthase
VIVSADSFLERTNALIAQVLDNHSTHNLHAIAQYLCLSENAKRARPLLCLYNHWLFDAPVAEDYIRIGIAAEFIHAASLLHDDVVDNASKRRGRASANALFGNARAVLAGNFLLTKAFNFLRTFPRPLADRAISVIADMTESALLEINSRASLDIDESCWHAIAQGKTGVLFAWCGYAAAFCAHNEDHADRLWSVGHHVGKIFQMADDLKDFDGDYNLKDSCNDIRNREPSLPLIIALNSSAHVKKIFAHYYEHEILSDEHVNTLRQEIIASGALMKIQNYMQNELLRAREKLAVFEGTLGKNFLDRWIADLINTMGEKSRTLINIS